MSATGFVHTVSYLATAVSCSLMLEQRLFGSKGFDNHVGWHQYTLEQRFSLNRLLALWPLFIVHLAFLQVCGES
jgi:hypothetical protein